VLTAKALLVRGMKRAHYDGTHSPDSPECHDQDSDHGCDDGEKTLSETQSEPQMPSDSEVHDGHDDGQDDGQDDGRASLRAVNLKRPRTVTGGSLAYFEATAGWPKGPKNVQEIADWPAHLCRNFFKGEAGKLRQARVFKILERGFVTHCDYGGRQAPEVSLKILAAEFEGYGLAKGWLVQWRYTETNKYILKLVKNSPDPPTHVVPGVQCLLDQKTLNAIRALRPDKKAPANVRADAYQQMDLIIEKAAPKLFLPGANCLTCLSHEDSMSLGCLCKTTWCDSRSEKDRATTCAVAGTLCTPHTSYGKREGPAHEGTEPWNIYTRKLASERHDLNFLENSPRMPIKNYIDKMGPTYVVLHAIFGPEELAIIPIIVFK
jgi:hypothetical protein